MFRLGFLYYYTLKRDRDEAAKWFMAAAALGHVHAMVCLGHVNRHDELPDGISKARYWYRKGIEAGHPWAAEYLKRLQDK